MNTTESLHIISDPAQAATALSDLRLRLLAGLRTPNSAAGLAASLGLPRQKVNYHVRKLEASGLIRKVGERQARGFTEALMQSRAAAFVVDPDAMGPVNTNSRAIKDRTSSAFLASAAAGVVRDVAKLRRQADASGQRTATLGMEAEVRFRTPEVAKEFSEALTSSVAALIATYHDDEGKPFSLFTGLYQKPRSTHHE